ncbi:ABC transporter ATP-binding protein [Pseudoscardovia suis]|uniref:ABC transporter n=1 Tax=Pseudoscardovia suis TaxID=987063 RepID=A0A261EYE6_9BIFI|nr:ABC transporter ATP-binding protein [Pseudoscardovia suis]OZG51889.1 ABC transporter [Pseudoscardovia suis]PJJ69512.1 energy-coupling factor transport system ATP-binding protein [Pseudoscardovia suis]
MTRAAVQLDHASFHYATGREGLHETTLALPAGQVVVLCGASGCGKTTLTRLINGLAPQYFPGALTGTVTVGGTDTRNADIAALAKQVGSVFQNPNTQFFTMNVRDELAFACENFAMPPDEIRARVESTARRFHLEGLLDRPLADMSGGQLQRVACAAVSTTNPGILVLDEPTSNLDATAIAALRAIVATWKSEGRTIVIAEHRLAWLDGLVDTAILLDGGRIARVFSREEWQRLTDAERRSFGLRPLTLQQLRDDCERKEHTPLHAPVHATEHATPAAVDTGRIIAHVDTGRMPAAVDTASTSTPIDAGHTSVCGEPLAPETTLVRGATPAYHVRGFRYRYPHARRDSLDIAALDLPCGAVTTIVGLNSAGKSTFARCLQGLDRRCKGTLITPDGVRLQARQRLDVCTTVLQDVNRELFTESVLAEVMLSQPHENEQAALNVLDSLGLRECADRHPLSLSGGQKQRVAIAAAIASERPVIIVDEPTSGLDLHHMHEVSQLIRGLARRGRTIVAVTHDPEFAFEVSDYVAHIVNGRLADWYPLASPGSAGKLFDALVPHIA